MEDYPLVPSYVPPSPPDEPERLAALKTYDLLDTPPEEAFEHIVELASDIFRMPIVLLTLLDEHRQWFKSRRGVPQEESKRHFAFCALTVLSDEGFIVDDTLEDERFRFNPLVAGRPGIRFYAGKPLVTPDGYRIGSISVADRVRRPDFGARQFDHLGRLADLVVDELELRITRTELRHQNQKLEFALNNAGMGHWSWDLNNGDCGLPGAAKKVVEQAGDVLPISERNDGALDGLLAVVHSHDRPQVNEAFNRLVTNHEALSATFRLMSKQRIHWVEVHADYEPGSSDRIIGTVRDTTEQEQWRAKMIRADRLHALDSLGAGVAHEINNPLSVVSTNLYLLAAWFRQNEDLLDEPDRNYLERLMNAARRGITRIDGIVSDMLELSRPEGDDERHAEAANVLRSVVRLLTSEIPANCELVTSIGDVPPVRGRPSVLAQVFVNLLTNAIEAVERSAERDKPHRIFVHCGLDGANAIAIEIRDTGPGLAAEERSQMFNPFFTTKPPGRGTGLGLAIAHSIVESLGGEIRVESPNHHGTKVTVSLPIQRQPRAPGDEQRPQVR